jgi:hypothetical protein
MPFAVTTAPGPPRSRAGHSIGGVAVVVVVAGGTAVVGAAVLAVVVGATGGRSDAP